MNANDHQKLVSEYRELAAALMRLLEEHEGPLSTSDLLWRGLHEGTELAAIDLDEYMGSIYYKEYLAR